MSRTGKVFRVIRVIWLLWLLCIFEVLFGLLEGLLALLEELVGPDGALLTRDFVALSDAIAPSTP